MSITNIQELVNEKALKAFTKNTSQKFSPLRQVITSSSTVKVKINAVNCIEFPQVLHDAIKTHKGELVICVNIAEILNAIEAQYLAENKDRILSEASQDFISRVEALQAELQELLENSNG